MINSPNHKQVILKNTDPIKNEWDLIEIYFEEPTTKPNDDLKTYARPYAIENGLIQYVTSNPISGEGYWFTSKDITIIGNKNFILQPKEIFIPEFIDPFQNPLKYNVINTKVDNIIVKPQNNEQPDDLISFLNDLE